MPAYVTAAAIVLLLLPYAVSPALVARQDLLHADAIVMLAGAGAYEERAAFAARLYREGRAPVIVLTDDGVLSGWSAAQQRNPYFVERAERALQDAGVAKSDIRLAGRVYGGTFQEVSLVRAYAERSGLHSLLFVTSNFHSARALWTVRHVFRGGAIGFGLLHPEPADRPSSAAKGDSLPKAWRDSVQESVKAVYYWVRYGLMA